MLKKKKITKNWETKNSKEINDADDDIVQQEHSNIKYYASIIIKYINIDIDYYFWTRKTHPYSKIGNNIQMGQFLFKQKKQDFVGFRY